jgi:hypothetical protein
MLSVLDDPAIRARAFAVSVVAFHQMIEHGSMSETSS